MSGQEDHPHVPQIPFTPAQHNATTAANSNCDVIPIEIDQNDSTTAATTATMPTLEEMQSLAAAQADQLQRANEMLQQQQQQMVDAQATFDAQAQQLRESAEQMRQQQDTINQLASAFQTLTTTTAATTAPSSSRKKPEMPTFDAQNIHVWIKRLTAAYDRAGVVAAKDKFAYLESTFDISFNPTINNFLYNSNNTDDDWKAFIAYMQLEYGPTIRQKARKLMGDLPRNGLKPSQYLTQLEEEVKDVKIDDIKKEHLLKSIPPRIREILGKAVETKTAKEVAKMADDYFDSQGRPLEKSATSISHVTESSSTTTATPQSSFTTAFTDDNAEVNFVKKGNYNSFKSRSRSRPRFNNGNNRPNGSSASTATSTASSSTAAPRQQQQNSSLCRFHRMFGDNATRCISNCSRHSAFLKKQQQQQQQGNGNGGRRQ